MRHGGLSTRAALWATVIAVVSAPAVAGNDLRLVCSTSNLPIHSTLIARQMTIDVDTTRRRARVQDEVIAEVHEGGAFVDNVDLRGDRLRLGYVLKPEFERWDKDKTFGQQKTRDIAYSISVNLETKALTLMTQVSRFGIKIVRVKGICKVS